MESAVDEEEEAGDSAETAAGEAAAPPERKEDCASAGESNVEVERDAANQACNQL